MYLVYSLFVAIRIKVLLVVVMVFRTPFDLFDHVQFPIGVFLGNFFGKEVELSGFACHLGFELKVDSEELYDNL